MNNDIFDSVIVYIFEEVVKKREWVKLVFKVIDGVVYLGVLGLNILYDDGWDGVKFGDFGFKIFDFSKCFKKIICNEVCFNCMLIVV